MVFSLLSAPAMAEFSGPEVDYGEEVEWAESDEGSAIMQLTEDAAVTASSGNVAFTSEGEGIDLKLSITGGVSLNKAASGSLNLETLWLTGSGSSSALTVSDVSVLASVKDVYVNGIRVYLGDNTARDLSSTNFYIGQSENSVATGGAFRNNSSLQIGDNNVNSAVTIRDLVIHEDNAQIGFSTEASLVVSGKLLGSGTFWIVTQQNGNAGKGLTLNGGAEFDGVIKFAVNNNYLHLGSSASIGALETSAHRDPQVSGIAEGDASITKTDTAGDVVLTLGQDSETVSRFGKQSESASTIGTSDARLSLTKQLKNTQSIYATSYLNNLTVSGGTLAFYGATDVSGSLTVNNGTLRLGSGSLTATGSIDLSGGTVSLEGGKLVVSGSASLTAAQSNAAIAVTVESYAEGAAIALTQDTIAAFLASGITIQLSGDYDETRRVTLKLFEGLDSFADYKDELLQMIVGMEDFDADHSIITLNDDGSVSIVDALQPSSWASGDGTWAVGDAGQWGEAYAGGVVVNFGESEQGSSGNVTISGSVPARQMSVLGGTWNFSLENAEDALAVSGMMIVGVSTEDTTSKAVVKFSGAGSVSATGLNIVGGSSVTVSTTGDKNFGSISVAEGCEFVITDATGTTWGAAAAASQKNVVTGQGALVYKDLGNVTGDSVMSLIYNTLYNTPNNGSAQLAVLKLENTQLNLSGNASYAQYFLSVTDIYVDDKSSIGFNNPTFNTGTPGTLHIAGTGINGEGAIYISDSTDRSNKWNIVLDGDASMGAKSGKALALEGRFNGAGHKLIKDGAGTLALSTNFTVVESSSGTFSMRNGATLNIKFTANKDTALANYDVELLGESALQIGQANYTIRMLRGEAGSTVGSTDANTRSLVLSNSDTGTDSSNTFCGSVGERVNITLSSGYWTLGNGAAFASVLTINPGGVVEFAGGADGSGSLGTLSGGGNLKVSSGTLSLTTITDYTGAITVASGATLQTGSTGNASITLDGGRLNVQQSAQSLNQIVVTANGATIGGLNFAENWQLDLTGITLNGVLSISLEGITLDMLESLEGYQLFINNLDLLTGGNVKLVDNALGRSVVTLNDDGSLHVDMGEAKTLTWNTTDGTWSATPPDTELWLDDSSSDEHFYNHDHVIFEDGDAGTNVSIDGAVLAGSMTVNAGVWNFSGVNDAALSLIGDLTVTAGSTTITDTVVTLGGNVTLGDQASLTMSNVTMTLAEAELSVGSGAELSMSTVDLSALSKLTVTGTGNDKGKVTLNSATLKDSSALEVNNADLEMSVTGHVNGLSVTGNGHVTINMLASYNFGNRFYTETDITFNLADSVTMQMGSQGQNYGIFGSGNISIVGPTGNGESATVDMWGKFGGDNYTGDDIYRGIVSIQGNVTLKLSGTHVRMGGLVAGSAVRTDSTSSHSLFLGVNTDSGTYDFAGILDKGAGTGSFKVVKMGGCTQILSGEIHDGIEFEVQAGLLQIGGTVSGSTHQVTLSGGTLEYVGNDEATFSNLRGTATASGTLKVNSANGNGVLKITALNSNFTGDVQVASGTLEYTGTAGATLANVSMSGGALKVSGTGAVVITSLSATAGELSVGSGASASISALGSNAQLSKLSVAGSLGLSAGTLSVGELALSDGAELGVSISGQTRLQLGSNGSITGLGSGEHATIVLAWSDLVDLSLEDYQFFLGDAWQEAWKDLFEVRIDGGNGKVTAEVDSRGYIHFINSTLDLVWNNSANGLWQENNNGWYVDGDATQAACGFGFDDNAIFIGSGEETVTVEGNIAANKITVRSGEWVLEDDPGDGSDELADSLTVSAGIDVQNGSLTIDMQSVTVKGTISGTVDLNGGSLTLTGAKVGAATLTVGADTTVWTESLTIGADAVTGDTPEPAKSATVEFESGSISGGGLVVAGGSTVTVSTSDSKQFGSISLGAGSRLVVTDATQWSNSAVSGQGTLEFSGLTSLDEAATRALVQATLTQNSVGSLAELRLTNQTSLQCTGGNTSLGNYLKAASKVVIESGSSLVVNSATVNPGWENYTRGVINITGNGGDAGGALVLIGRTCSWDVELAGNATISVQSRENATASYLQSTLNANGNTLTIAGGATLELSDDSAKKFNTVDGSSGTLQVDGTGGTELRLSFSANGASTVLANYKVDLVNNGSLRVKDHDYTILALSGTAGTALGLIPNITQQRTLTISNDYDAASAANGNIFSGTLEANMTLAVAAGYQKMDGTVADGANLAVSGGTLELAAAIQGASTLAVSGGVLDVSSMTRGDDAQITLLASGTTGVVKGLHLGAGDVLGFANAGASATEDPEVLLTLTGATVLGGGSELQFGVRKDNDGWVTATSLAVGTNAGDSLSITATAENKLKLTIDPFHRMASGEVLAWESGNEYKLISCTGLTDSILDVIDVSELVGRFYYELEVKSDGLYLHVVQGAAELVWNVAAGGEWNMADQSWLSDGMADAFHEGDAVVFDTLADAGGNSVQVQVVDGGVSVGGITVKGSTSYDLVGNIAGTTGDVGLVVGTTGDDGEAFTGVLTLNGTNSWTGDNSINSGTVVAAKAGALSSSATALNGGELQLNFNDADTLTSALSISADATLTALQNGTVAAELAGGTLQAATGTTLTVRQSGATVGSLKINAGTGMAGTVLLQLGQESVKGTGLAVSAGKFSLAKGTQDAATLTVNGNIDISAEAVLEVGDGAELAGHLNNAAGELSMLSGSKLTATGSVATLTSAGAELTAKDFATVSTLMTLLDQTTLHGEWDIAKVAGDAALVVDTDAEATLRAGLAKQVQAHGSLHVGDGMQIGALTMDAGTLDGADGNAAQISAEKVQLSGTAEMAANVDLLLTGSGSSISGDAQVKGSITVNQAASGMDTPELTIGGDAAVSGALHIENGRVLVQGTGVTGEVTLYGASATLDLGGTASAMSIVMLNGGTLQQAALYSGVITVDDSTAATDGVVFDLGGAGADARVTLRSITGGNTVQNLESLTLAGQNTITINSALRVDAGSAGIFSFTGSGELVLGQGASLYLDLSSVLGEVLASGSAGVSYQLSNKSLESWYDKLTYDATVVVLQWQIEYYDNGVLHIVANDGARDRNIYQSSQEQGGSNDWAIADGDHDIYESVGSYGAIVVDKQTDIDLRGTTPKGIYEDTGLLLHNLMGTDAGSLNIQGDGSSKVTLQNDVSDADMEDLRDQLGGELVKKSLTYGGDINIDSADMEVKHVDGLYSSTPGVDSTTVVKGNLTLTNGDLLMTSGRLELNGEDNLLEQDVHFNAYDGQLSVSGRVAVGGTLTVQDNPDAVGDERAHVQLVQGGELVLQSGASVERDVIIGSDEVNMNAPRLAGTVTVGDSWLSTGSISAGSQLRHVVLQVHGTLEVDTSNALARYAANDSDAWVLAGLTGSGSVVMSSDAAVPAGKDITFLVAEQDRYFYGDLEEYRGTMRFCASDYAQYFVGVQGSENWNVANETGGRVVFDLATNNTRGNDLTLGSLTMAEGSYTTILFDLTQSRRSSGMQLQSLTIENGADVTIGHYQGTIWLDGDDGDAHDLVLGRIEVTNGGDKFIGDDVSWHLKNVRNGRMSDVWVDADGTVYASVRQDNTNQYANRANNVNSATGAQLLWGKNETPDLMALDNAVYELLGGDGPISAKAAAEGNRLLAAAAGASVATISSAFAADVERQLRSIRNRTTTMQPGHSSVEDDPQVSTWLQAESNYYKQNADGLLPGFKTSGWGGTVGVNTGMGSSSVVGLAMSAMYNDLNSDGPDSLKGHMDTLYLSGFVQITDGAWKHTFVASVGRAEIDVDRTVNYGYGSYTTSGSTEAIGVGFLYEVGYSFSMNEEGTTCLQPLASIAWRNARFDDYRETGSDAALAVKGQDINAVTLSMGARMQTAVGADAWNRIGVLELRAIAKAELADRAGAATVAFSQSTRAAEGSVRSAEKGALGLELGAGLTLPVGQTSETFVDLSAEAWNNLIEVNANIGYRFSF